MVLGYLCGSIPFGVWLVKLLKGVDIRSVGSHNIGATNVWRTFGWRLGLPVMVLDILKGFVPTLVATLVAGHLAGVLTGAAAMVGHARPACLRCGEGREEGAAAAGPCPGLWRA